MVSVLRADPAVDPVQDDVVHRGQVASANSAKLSSNNVRLSSWHFGEGAGAEQRETG